MRIQPFLALAALLAATFAPQVHAEQPKQIAFVCLHGSVKSQMAAAYFNDIAKQRGLPFVAILRGIETDKSIPPRIRDGLAVDGLKPLDDVPQDLTAQEADSAVKVLAFDDVPAERKGSAEVTYWSDVPLDRKDYARDTRRHHPAYRRADPQPGHEVAGPNGSARPIVRSRAGRSSDICEFALLMPQN